MYSWSYIFHYTFMFFISKLYLIHKKVNFQGLLFFTVSVVTSNWCKELVSIYPTNFRISYLWVFITLKLHMCIFSSCSYYLFNFPNLNYFWVALIEWWCCQKLCWSLGLPSWEFPDGLKPLLEFLLPFPLVGSCSWT